MLWCSGGGVFVSTPAYADGYVDGTGNNIYYGYKTDASYSEARFHIEVDYYDTLENAKVGGTTGKNPLGKFVRVHYLSNCDQTDGGKADDWRFRPMWWFGVPAGLKEPQDIHFKRTEKLTSEGNKKITPTGSSQQVTTDANGYGVVSDRSYATPKEWKGISNFYLTGDKVLASKGWKQLLGLDDKGSKGYDKVGNTEKQWEDYQKETAGLQGIFVDWESAGTRYYDMTYVAEMTQDAWEKRDEHPLRFAAGVYRFAGNWHYAAGQKHNTPKIADHLTLKYPDVTLVKNLKKLNDGEKGKVKQAIEDANRGEAGAQTLFDKLVKDDQDGIVVNDDGSAIITFKDKTTRTIPANILVAKVESDSDKYKPVMPERTPVVKPSKLTKEDKEAVLKAFKKANEKNTDFNSHLADSDGIKFDDKGENLVVTYKDGSKATIPASELVYQGATIADWAPYVVPDTIEVKNLSSLTAEEQGRVTAAFDAANADLDVYAKAKKDGKTPVTFDKDFKNAIITWADGSTSTIPSWQFLKEAEHAVVPQPEPVVKKEFKVTPKNISNVNFNPFKTTVNEISSGMNKTQLDGLKSVLASYAKDAESGNAVSGVTVVYGVDSTGAGTVTFKAGGYNDKTYPMSMFFQQKIASQKPAPDTTLHHPGNMTAYQYYVDPVAVDNVNSPKPEDQIAAFKKFMKKNYNVDITDQEAMSAYTLKPNDKPVAGVTNMQRYVKGQNNGAGVVSFSLNSNGTIAVQGFETEDNNSKKLFDVPLKDLYVAKTQTPTDNTFDQLKKQALALWNQKNGTEQLTDRDFKRVGITDPSKYPADINSMTDTPENKTALRKLIQQLTEATKVTRKYNNPADVEVENASNPTDEDFKKAIKAFLDANYTGAGDVNSTTYSMTSALKPKSSTADMEPYDATKNPVGITTISKGNGNKLTVACKDGTSFTVDITFKKKQDTPAGNDLEKLKKQAKELIERNPKLTDDQKTQYKNEIDKADTKEKIQEILKKANEQAGNNNVKPEDIKNKEKEEKEKREKEQKEKEDKKQKEQKNKELEDKKKKASYEIDNLNNLTTDEKKKLKEQINGKSTTEDPNGATTPEEVQKILDDAKNLNEAHEMVKVGELPFLDHGTGKDEDKALNDILGSKSAKDSVLTTLEEKIKDGSTATAEEIKNALDAAKRQNKINKTNAKAAANAKLNALEQEITSAESALTDAQKTDDVKAKISAAKEAITKAKNTVNSATKPSQIKDALNIDATIKDAKDAINTQVSNAQKNNVKDPSQTQNGQLDDEKKKQIERINNSNLSKDEKEKAIEDIKAATKSGDPTAIADRALKAKKIKDALDAIGKLTHLNDAQKKAYEDIINTTDAHNIKDDDGKDTGKDDIDNALANATATDTAMARLEKLKKTADDFSNGEKYKNCADQDKKDAFNAANKAAKDVLDKANGDAKNADQVNELYKDLLKAMQAIDDKVKGAGVSTDALQAEVDNDSKLKPTPADPNDSTKPATPGDSLYTTASKEKKEAFDQALSDAEAALKTANDDNANDKKPGTTPRTPEQEAKAQKAVDDALKKLEEARKALDGVNTKPLEQQIAKDADIKANVKYTNADSDKKSAYDKALKDAKDLIAQLTGTADQQAQPGQSGQQPELKTKEQKQKALNDKLKALQKAYNELNGVAPTPTPAPTPAAVDKTALAVEIALDSTIGRRMSYTVSPSDKQLAYDRALSKARAVYADPSATQDDVNAAIAALRAAARALSGYGSVDNDVNPLPSPLPTPVPGGHEDSGFGVNDNAPTTVDKGELNVQIDSAEADSQPGNAGNGNAGNAGNANAGNAGAGNTNAGNAGNNNANNANGANSAAVNAAVESNPAVKQADVQVSKAQAALDAALAEAKKVAADPNATQAQVDAAAQKLSAARKALASAKAHAAEVRASVRAQVLKSGVSQLSKTGSNVSVFGLLATVAAAGAAFFVAKRRGTSRHSNN
ncbi:GA module [Gardnerella greenwoodii]|uniref:GA module n=1 Tax=Gardnerella greenwoodii TaxID=2914925 RepID=UPI003970D426